MLITKWCRYSDENGKVYRMRKKMTVICSVSCDKCKDVYEIKETKLLEKREKWTIDYCSSCVKEESLKRFVMAGSNYLSNRTPEEKKKHGSIGGIACTNSGNRDTISFSSKRWENMSPEEQHNQVTKASKGLHDKLNNDPEFKEEFYKKVFKNSKIGFISKGQREVFQEVCKNGFLLEECIEGLFLDMVNKDTKKIIEYNGDFYHCNPRDWKEDEFNNVLNMKAGEKWKKDRNRRFFLRSKGYEILVIWEKEWYGDRERALNKIEEFINDKIPRYEYKPSLPLKGRTFEEIHGEEKAKELKQNMSKRSKGRILNSKIFLLTLPNSEIQYICCNNYSSGWMKNVKNPRSVKKEEITKEKMEELLLTKNVILYNNEELEIDNTSICPYCNKKGNRNRMKRYHFNNCKHKDNNEA